MSGIFGYFLLEVFSSMACNAIGFNADAVPVLDAVLAFTQDRGGGC